MNIEIKISKKPIEYHLAIKKLEERVLGVKEHDKPELIWILKHKAVYTGGTSFSKKDILEKDISVLKTNRGGKITYHDPGQLIFYFVINLNKRKKDIRWFVNVVEKTVIQTLKFYNIKSFADKKNIGIWINHQNEIKKISSIGLKVKKWIIYHGFSINISTNLKGFKKIVPCGIKNRQVTNLKEIKNSNFLNLNKVLISNFLKNLEG
tara:strand:- start:2909 stop:3529 length:621 start_codon:yes stop_codon:yes gene_type:complete